MWALRLRTVASLCIGSCRSFGVSRQTWNWNIVCTSFAPGLRPSPEVSHHPRCHLSQHIHHRTHCAWPGRLTGNTFGTFWTYLSVDPCRQTPFRQSLQLSLQVQVQVQFQGVVLVLVQECLYSGRFPHCRRQCRQYPQDFPLEQPQDFPQSAFQLLQPSPQPHPGELI